MVKTLGSRVEQEHAQHLRDVHRIEQQTVNYGRSQGLNEGNPFGTDANNGEVDFESLVKGTSSSPLPPSTSAMGSLDPWDEGWAVSSEASSSLVRSATISHSLADLPVQDLPDCLDYHTIAICLT